MKVDFKRAREYLSFAQDESLQEHDDRYHGGHFDPDKGKCGKREGMSGGDDSDKFGGEDPNAGTTKLAPNGKRSNLTNRQYAQVRSKAFKDWFGDWEANILHNLATRAWEDKSFVGKFVFEPSRKLGDKLKDLIGHDINEIVITADSVRHMKNHHGDVSYEAARGQVAMTSDDIVVLPYVLNSFDAAIRDPTYDLRDGNKAVTLYKRINGVSVVTTISKGKNKQFVVSGWKVTSTGSMPKNVTPNLNALSDVDLSIVQQDIAKIKRAAKECSKVVDENGEPRVMFHGSDAVRTEFRMRPGMGGVGAYFTSAFPEAADYVRGKVGDAEMSEDECEGFITECFLNVRDENSFFSSNYGYGEVIVRASDPTQIKSATGNRGSFDPNDPDIRR